MVVPPVIAGVVIVAVTIAFIVTFTMQFIIPDYQPETAIYGLFGAIVSYVAWTGKKSGEE
jgi:hypothetical protein